MKVKALVLDFDGVIADTEPCHFRAFQQVLAGVGLTLSPEDYSARYLGFDDEGAFRAVWNDQGRSLTETAVADLVRAKAALLDAALAGGDLLFPGAADAVRRLSARVPIAVASGALRHEIETVLRRANLLSCIRAIVAAGDTPAGKPAPDPYVKAVAALDVRPSQAIAVEDSQWGVQSARAAGLRCVAVTTSYPASAFADADLVVPDLAALTFDLLERRLPD